MAETKQKPSQRIVANPQPISASRNGLSNVSNMLQRRGTIDEMGDDDDLLLNLNIDQLTNRAYTEAVTQPFGRAPLATSVASLRTQQEDEHSNAPAAPPPKRLRSASFENMNDHVIADMHIEDDAFLDDDSFDAMVQKHTASSLVAIVSNDEPSSPVEASILSPTYRFKLRGCSLVTVAQLDQCSDADKCRRGQFVLKAEIDSIVETVRVTRSEWSLGAQLHDYRSTALLRVRFTSDVLSLLAGATPHEINEMKSMRKQRPQIEAELTNVSSLSMHSITCVPIGINQFLFCFVVHRNCERITMD